jgi:transcriptional regulator with XRE-family HTH domain
MSARSDSAVVFGRTIKRFRVERGLSQEEAGLRCGVARGFFGKLERGEANPTFATILKVSSGLEVSAAELVAVAERQLGHGQGSVAAQEGPGPRG